VGISLVEHLASAQAHDAPSEAGKLAVDLVPIYDAVLGQDFFQESLELCDIPLTLAQVVQQPPLGALTIDPERQIKGSARGYDAEMAIEHDQRLGDGIHDGLRQRAYVLNSQKGLDVGHDRGSFELTRPGQI
jgi:hypothetical protein